MIELVGGKITPQSGGFDESIYGGKDFNEYLSKLGGVELLESLSCGSYEVDGGSESPIIMDYTGGEENDTIINGGIEDIINETRGGMSFSEDSNDTFSLGEHSESEDDEETKTKKKEDEEKNEEDGEKIDENDGDKEGGSDFIIEEFNPASL
jgi:hypothetical protein